MTSATAQGTDKKKDKEFEAVINGTEIPSTTTADLRGARSARLPRPRPRGDVHRHLPQRRPVPRRQANGTLVAGESVTVKKKGTTFDVRLTTRS